MFAVLLVSASAVLAQEVNVNAATDEAVLAIPEDSLVEDTVAMDSIAEPVALPWPQNVQARLDAILLSRQFQTTQIGLQVYDLTADSVIYQYNERQQMRPASTMKMINAVTTLDKLGGNYQFRTRLYYTGKVDSCVLRGNLYCKGGMDPAFNSRPVDEGRRPMGRRMVLGRRQPFALAPAGG